MQYGCDQDTTGSLFNAEMNQEGKYIDEGRSGFAVSDAVSKRIRPHACHLLTHMPQESFPKAGLPLS
jgi:hypothetical protein